MQNNGQVIDAGAISEMDKYTKLINQLEASTDEEVHEYHKTIRKSNGGTGNLDVAGMEAAINALYEAQRVLDAGDTVTTANTDDSDSIDDEMTYDDAEIIIESHGKYHSMLIGGIPLITKSYSLGGLNRIKAILESGKGFDSVEVSRLLRNIGIQTSAMKTINESKTRYKKYKDSGDSAGMNEQKRIYNSAKRQLENSRIILED